MNYPQYKHLTTDELKREIKRSEAQLADMRNALGDRMEGESHSYADEISRLHFRALREEGYLESERDMEFGR